MNIRSLTTSERILLAQELWESVHDESNEVSVSPAQVALLEERLALLESDRNHGDTWENAKDRIVRR